MKIAAFIIGMLCATTSVAQSSIKPGQTWNDTGGSAINAHGGCVQYHDGYYYWFGEERSKNACAGISCYRSTDLIKWQKLSRALTPTGTKTDDNRDIASGRTLERPKVIYNAATGKWVMWVHWENGSDYGQAKVCVAQADKIEGPYTMVDVFRPNGHDSRDQTLFLDNDGTAYHIYSTGMNTNTHISPLNPDFLTPTEEVNVQMKGKKYEAASVYRVGDMYFGLFSGCTGWTPNRGRYAYAYDMMGTWVYGTDFRDQDGSTGINFCTDASVPSDKSASRDNTYKSQSAYVFQLHGRDRCFVYVGDRWNSSNVQSSTPVWLPLSMRSGYPAVRWHDAWTPEVFDDMYRYKRTATIDDGGEYLLLERASDRIVSRPASSLTLENDGESNVTFRLHATDMPYTYKIEDTTTGRYATAVFGTLRFQAANDGDGQLWTLLLEEDGYYKIWNRAEDICLTVSGNDTSAGTAIYANAPSAALHQSFGLYFDSTAHPEYAEADLFGAGYRSANRAIIEQQSSYLSAITAPWATAAHRYYRIDGTSTDVRPRGLYIERGVKKASK